MDNTYSTILNKKVIKSFLDMLIMHLIKDKPMSGNKILKEINSRFNVSLSPASIYSALSSLQEQGLVVYSSDKMPTLTEKGKAVRKKLIEDYLGLLKKIEINLLIFENHKITLE